MHKILTLFLLLGACLVADLPEDLMLVECIDKEINDRLPVYYNHLLYGGYFQMPSARMGEAGEIGLGYASAPPYRLWNLRCQLTDYLEISGNYRIYSGVEDPILSQYGFGDLSDKGANIKLAIVRPEDSGYRMPGLAIGFDDVIGTRGFKAGYFVMTQVFMECDLEVSLGWGWERYRGLFGGAHWLPFRKGPLRLFEKLAIGVEYDAIPYKDHAVERHPKGRSTKTPFNVGLKWRIGDYFDLSVSSLRGKEVSATVSAWYNFGTTEGFITKFEDPLPYTSPRNLTPLGPCRPEEKLAGELVNPFNRQGFDLLEIALNESYGCKTLYLRVFNNSYRTQDVFRERISFLLANLIPDDIDQVIVILNSEGFPVQQYRFFMPFVREFGQCDKGLYELSVLSPIEEAKCLFPENTVILQRDRMPLTNFYVEPKSQTYFGSAKGKFKYILGLHTGVDGFLPGDIYYSVLLGLNIFGDLHDVADVDRLNPSQIINVRTDLVDYYKNKDITLDECFVQKNWAFGNGFYGKFALGYFEVEYAGLASEYLWYPVCQPFAIGVEGAIFKKREYRGLGFQNRIRKLDGFRSTYLPFTGSQYFLNLYYRWFDANLDFKVSGGKFLANDYGVRFQVSRYFDSGLRIYAWYTLTNGGDQINGKTYYDKGVGFSMPLDIFYTHSDRERWGYGMSAWLRDVGVKAKTGRDLYEMITEERQ